MHPVELVGSRVCLREFEFQDVQSVIAYAADEKTTRLMNWPTGDVHDVPADQVGKRLQYDLAIALNSVAIGSCALRINIDNLHEAEIGYIIRRDLWGNGYMTEAASLMVKFGFERLGLHRIRAFHDTDNVASRRVMEKIGMTYEGRLRDHLRNRDGVYRDSEMHSILSTDIRPGLVVRGQSAQSGGGSVE